MLYYFLPLLSLIVTGAVALCPVPNHHCDCADLETLGQVTCREISEIPGGLPNTTTALDVGQGFIGPILEQRQISRLTAYEIYSLYADSNKIEAIQDNAFINLPQLEVLDLSGNNIEALSTFAFAGLDKLTVLYLSNSNLQSIALTTMGFVKSLDYIDLEGNKLTSIQQQFSYNAELETLLLARNEIEYISPDAFSNLPQLRTLSLFGNKITHPTMLWFETVIENKGTLEISRRQSSPITYPNPWLCCKESVSDYKSELDGFSPSLAQYEQLNLVCSWPPQVSGSLLSNVEPSLIYDTKCSDHTSTTTTTQVTSTTTTSTATGEEAEISTSKTPNNNFLWGANDGTVVFLLLLFAFLSGITTWGVTYWFLRKRNAAAGDEKELMDNQSRDFELKVTQRPFQQTSPNAYGATNITYENSQSASNNNNKLEISSNHDEEGSGEEDVQVVWEKQPRK